MGNTPKDRMKARQAEIESWEKSGEVMTPSQKFDIISDAVQTVKTPWVPNPTLHRTKKKATKGYKKGGVVKKGRKRII